jgi:hypothetical protein
MIATRLHAVGSLLSEIQPLIVQAKADVPRLRYRRERQEVMAVIRALEDYQRDATDVTDDLVMATERAREWT